MALTVTKADLLRYIGRKLGYNRTPASFTSAQATDANDVLNNALRRFYEPDILPGEREKHQWGFLKPTTSLSLTANNWFFALPSNFSMLDGPITYARGEDNVWPALQIVGVQAILAKQQQNDSAGRPYLAAIRPKEVVAAGTMTHELIVYPTSDDAYTLSLTYKINPYSLDSDSNLPSGGEAHVQTIIAACMAECAAFDEMDDGREEQRFMERLRASVSHDRSVYAPETLGISYDSSDAYDIYDGHAPQVRMQSWGNLTTVNGVVPDG